MPKHDHVQKISSTPFHLSIPDPWQPRGFHTFTKYFLSKVFYTGTPTVRTLLGLAFFTEHLWRFVHVIPHCVHQQYTFL